MPEDTSVLPGPDPSARIADLFESRYRSFQYHFVAFLTDHLADVSRAFDGDLQEMLVLAVVGQVRLHADRPRPEGTEPCAGYPAISASRIADVTGIPRQTVRRKLKALEHRGWIERTPDASYRLAVTEGISRAKEDLSELDRRGIRRAARLYCNLSSVLAGP